MQYNNLNESINLKSFFEKEYKLSFKKKGNELIALCPFHNDTKPSFSINTQKNMYNCFACNKGGNAVDIAKEYYKVEGIALIQKLEEEGYKEATIYSPTSLKEKTTQYATKTLEKIFNHCIPLTEPNEYLKSRGIETIPLNSVYRASSVATIEGLHLTLEDSIIPIYEDITLKTIISLQVISKDNEKRFLKDHSVKGGCMVFKVEEKSVYFYMVEGAIDGLSINQVKKNSVITFSLNNMYDVALKNHKALHEKCSVFSDRGKIEGAKQEPREVKQAKLISSLLNTIVCTPEGKAYHCKDANDVLVKCGKDILLKCIKGEENELTEALHLLKDFITNKKLSITMLTSEAKDPVFYYEEVGLEVESWAVGTLETKLATFFESYTHLRVKGKKLTKPLIEAAITAGVIPTASKTTYDPEKGYLELVKDNKELCLNMYQESELMTACKKEVALKGKSCVDKNAFPNIMRLLKNLTLDDKESCKWLINFLAGKVQYPKERNKMIIVFQGTEGTGKNVFKTMLNYIFFDKNVNTHLNNNDLSSRFTDTLSRKLFCCIEEADKLDSKQHNQIKSYSGSSTMPHEAKFCKSYSVPNYATFLMFTNKQLVANVDASNTRFSFLKNFNRKLSSYLYSEGLVNSVEDTSGTFKVMDKALKEELPSFIKYLLTYEVDKNLYDTPHKNKAFKEQVEASKPLELVLIEELATNSSNIIQLFNGRNNNLLPYKPREDVDQVFNTTSSFYIEYSEDSIRIDVNAFKLILNDWYEQHGKSKDLVAQFTSIHHNQFRKIVVKDTQEPIYNYATTNQKFINSKKVRFIEVLKVEDKELLTTI